MIKKELQQMPKLKATPHMMRLASEDKPTKITYWGKTNIQYRRLGYTRCCVKNGILKLALFFTESMRMGGTLPYYEIYFDRNKRQYLTYDCGNEKWLTASFYRLPMPSYDYYIDEKLQFSRETNKTIRKYFNTEKNGIDAISSFQHGILAENLKKRHKRETDPWDEDLKQTPELPKDWLNWASKVGIPEHYIFYSYSRKKTGQTGYCSHCGKDVPIKNPKYNKRGRCPRCHVPITYKAIGKCGRVVTGYYPAHLIQRCKDGLMLREFQVQRIHPRKGFAEPEVNSHEIRRVICDKDGVPNRAYYYGDYKHAEFRWISTRVTTVSRSYYYRSYEGKLYGKTLPHLLKNELKKTGITEYYRRKGVIEPERFLLAINESPYLEKLAKVGLTTLFDELIRGIWGGDEIAIDEKQTSLIKMLHVDSRQLKRMRDCNSGKNLLRWLQYEKLSGKPIPDKVLEWMCKNDITPHDLKFIRDKMSIEQIYNYINRKIRDENMNLREALTTWSDYLSMAKSLKMDTSNEKNYRVKNLRLKHNELVAIINEKNKDMAIRIGEILDMYPNVEDVMSEIKPKYEFADENYTIVVPSSVKEILIEGIKLSHCVSNDKYWERISTNESYVLFLRKTKDPDTAYYTLEVEHCGTIRQKRTLGDKQNKDIKNASEFLLKWQSEIKKRMSNEDRQLAEKSKTLRLQEFAQMDRDNILIRTGYLQGHRLVDVLMADLMEVAA